MRFQKVAKVKLADDRRKCRDNWTCIEFRTWEITAAHIRIPLLLREKFERRRIEKTIRELWREEGDMARVYEVNQVVELNDAKACV